MSIDLRIHPHIPLRNSRFISKKLFDNPLLRVYYHLSDEINVERPNWNNVKGATKIASVNDNGWRKVDFIKFNNSKNLLVASLQWPELTNDAKDRAWRDFAVDIPLSLKLAIECYEEELSRYKKVLNRLENEPDKFFKKLDYIDRLEFKSAKHRGSRSNSKLTQMLKNLRSSVPRSIFDRLKRIDP